VRLWPYARADGEHTVDVLRRLRAEIPDGKLTVVWDGAPCYRAKAVWAEAASLGKQPSASRDRSSSGFHGQRSAAAGQTG